MSRLDVKLVAIDSNTLVWGIRRHGTDEQRNGTDEQRKRARWLFQQLNEEEAQIIVPSVALAEYLTAIDVEGHRGVVAALTERFQVLPFDIRCASLAAKMFKAGAAERARADGWRECLRADSLIIATAAIHGAQVFYSGDAGCRALAKKHTRMTVKDMPTMQPNLLSDLPDPPTHPPAPKRKRVITKKS